MRYLTLGAVTLLVLLVASGAPGEAAGTGYVLKSTDVVEPGVVVVPAAEDRGVDGWVAAFNAARKKPEPAYPVRMAINLVAAGPRLDGVDEVTIGKIERKDDRLALRIAYTSARVRGENLRRNKAWTPLAIELLPHGLQPGKYTLTVTWQCSDAPAGDAKKPEDLVQETHFELTAAP